MRVLYFGSYDPNYSRNNILISGLRQNGVEVLECHDRSPGLKKFINLYKKHRELKNKYDAMVIGFAGHQIVPFAKLITRKPVIFDAFLSVYDSNIFDRKLASRYSFKALYYWLLDWLSIKLADVVLFDTYQHINYAVSEFGVRKNKFKRIFIGAQDDIFYPRKDPRQKNDKFVVFFHGSFIPLQGIEYIIKAAKILENQNDIEFIIFGGGQVKEEMVRRARDLNIQNITFMPHTPIKGVAEEVGSADVCLGIFGNTTKTQRVIPNKVYECLAAKKPIITADTPAIRELFTEEDLMLVKAADEKSLADTVMRLKENTDLAEKLAESGYKKVKEHAVPLILGKELKDIVGDMLSTRFSGN